MNFLVILQYNALMKINGNSGSLDGSKILASIVHAIVTPDLLSQFTMTGKTGNKDVTKEKFRIYVNIIDIIWRVASAADASYTKHKFTNDFTYKIIKYAYRFRYVQNKLSSHSVYHCTINKKNISIPSTITPPPPNVDSTKATGHDTSEVANVVVESLSCASNQLRRYRIDSVDNCESLL